jgi:hypothetical protein
MASVPEVRLPGGKLRGPEAQVVLNESYRTQEMHAGAGYSPFEAPHEPAETEVRAMKSPALGFDAGLE